MKINKTTIAVALGFCFVQINANAAIAVQANPKTLHTDQKAATQLNSWVEIDLQAFENNLRLLRNSVNPHSKICAILKADAYGHGIATLMPSVIKMSVPCVGIASNSEAKIVRESGFKGRLMRVRTGTLEEVAGALKYKVEELVGNAQFAQDIGKIAQQNSTTIKIHVALNSAGMSRNGLELSTPQGKDDALKLVQTKGLKTVGIMTHFAVEEREDVLQGLATFNAESAWLIKEAHLDRKQVLLHAANSFATLHVPESHLDMVRPGAAIYGDMSALAGSKRVASFKSKVTVVNAYPEGNTVGYDRTYRLKRDSRLANISVGYSDGYRRIFSNKAEVLIQGHRVPVVGRVSMNTLMVDVTDFPDIKSGDEVVLFGRQGKAEISADELEKMNGALLADLYTVWGNSNPKVVRR